jgi:starch synthase (maltosyl-transferring)
LRAIVAYQRQNENTWTEVELTALPNDAWVGSFLPAEKGFYNYKIVSWIDPLTTWYKGFLKKHADGQHMDIELTIGANMLTEVATRYEKNEAKSLLAVAKSLGTKKDYLKAIELVISDDFKNLISDFPFKNFPTESRILQLKVERERANFSAWYEFFPRSSRSDGKHGTFKDAEKLLPRVAEMGFDILYFPPIHPVGEVNRKGKNNAVVAQEGEHGSPWAIGSRFGGHKSISPELGTLEDYVHLIKKAKDLGLEVALDLALQCAPDHPYIKEHPEWFVWRPDGSIMYAENPPKKYQDIVPLNFECDDWQNMWSELKSIVEFWIENGVNVFRVDNPHTKPIVFWHWCISEVQKKYPDVIFLAEAFTRPKVMGSLAKIGFTQGYSYFTWRVKKAEIVEYMTTLTQTESREYYRPNFWPNTPDILPYHLHGRNSNAFFLRLAMAATLSSNYGVYGAAYEFCDNTAFHGKEEYMDSEKYEIKTYDWSVRNRITTLMTLLNTIRRNNIALQTTWNIQFTQTNNEHLLSYIKMSIEADGSRNIIWCVANLDSENSQSGIVEVPKALLGITGAINIVVEDLLTGEAYTWKNDWNYVELNPYKIGIHVFRAQVY